MEGRLLKKLVVLMLVVVSLFGFTALASAKTFKVGMVTDVGGLGDQSFNDAAYRGLEQLKKDLGVQITVIESAMMTDYVVNLSSLAEQGYDLVWGIGFLMLDALEEVAELYPDTKFGLIDAVVDAPNVASVVFNEHEGSFLVGLMAGMKTKTNKVGFIGGMDFALIHKFEAGFIAGVKTANPKADVIIGYTGVFDDPNKGKELALTQFSQGADVIYHASGACGIGVIKAAQEKGLYAIGVDSPQSHLAPNNVFTSMLKRVDNGVYMVSKDMIRGNWTAGTTVLGLAEKGVGYEENAKKFFTKDQLDIVNGYGLQIIAGVISVPETRDQLKAMFK